MRIELPSGTEGELVVPPVQATRGLVVAPDIMGLRPLFDELCERLSTDHGWATCAVEPFPGQEQLDLAGRMDAVAGLEDARVLGDLQAAADVVADRADVERIGVLGFCMGGMYTLKAAGTGRFDRAVSFYGMIRLPENWRGPAQQEPLEYVTREGACPVLAILGGHDQYTPPDDIEALRGSGGHITVRVYDDAEHGFVHDPNRPAHRPHDAADAWDWAVQFLA